MSATSKKIAVVGAGYSGLSAAYDLVKAGHQVEIFEADNDIGGLAGTFEISPGYRIEKFYHHWFTSDNDVLNFIAELGLSSKLRYLNSNTGLYYANSIFRLASPLDLLKFNAIPVLDRIRTGLMALYARQINSWHELENISAEDWLKKIGGTKAYEVVWKPLLHGKFGIEAENISAVWIWNKLKLRGSSRNSKGKEALVYFQGGFGALTDAMRVSLEKAGVKINTACAVKQIVSSDKRVQGVQLEGGVSGADLVLATTPLPTFLELCTDLPQDYLLLHSQMRFLGNCCLVLRLKQSLSSTYWLNVADPSFPFVGVIEHTNLDARENYGGEHIAFISKYLSTSEPAFALNDSAWFEYCLPYLQKIFPKFSKDWVIGYKLWKARYSQPVITKHFSKLIPAIKTPIENLWLATMAQIYPEDRGTNYAVRQGRMVAREILKSL